MNRRCLIALAVIVLAAGGVSAQRPAEPTVLEGPPCMAEVDYLLWWLKPVCLKAPTLSVGNPADPVPGALGQPGTRLVQGGSKFEFPGASGVRVRLGNWLSEDRLLGVELGGFVLEQKENRQPFRTSGGAPATYLVFQTPANEHAALPFSVPGLVDGSSEAVGSTHLWGLEANLASWFGARDYGDVSCGATLLAGCRYLQIDDRVVVRNVQSLVADPSAQAAGEADFATRNQFVGAQLGARFGVACGAWLFELTPKVALGETHLVSTVRGGPLLSGQGLAPPLVPGPVLALPSNVGRRASDRIAVVTEATARLRWQFHENAALHVGYNALYWSKVLCPGDQMDTHVNVTQLPFRGPEAGRRDPARLFQFTDAFYQGLDVGVALLY
jgi:hypothetical protein